MMADHDAGLSTPSDTKKEEWRAALYLRHINKKPFTLPSYVELSMIKHVGISFSFVHRALHIFLAIERGWRVLVLNS